MGLAILPDNETLLVGVTHTGNPKIPGWPWPEPFAIEKYRLSSIRPHPLGEWQIGPQVGRSKDLPGVPAEILLADGGRLAHVLTENGWIVTLDTATLNEVGLRIRQARADPQPRTFDRVHAELHGALTTDERYLISNRWAPAALNVADLDTRQAWSVALEPDVAITGGVDMNRGWKNAGLLAVYGGNQVLVYAVDAQGQLTRRGSAPLMGGSSTPFAYSGPGHSIAWSANGSKLIAGAPERTDLAEFVVFDVEQEGAVMVPIATLAACLEDVGGPALDILTANGYIPPPPPTATPVATATATPTGTPSLTPMPTATPTTASTSTPTAVRTAEPQPVYLPLVLAERCAVDAMGLDVVIVLDMSTSMERPARDGRPKHEAARQAAGVLLGYLDLRRANGGGRDRAALVGL